MTNKELFENYLSVVLEESTQKMYMTRIGRICSELNIEDMFLVEDISIIDEWLSVVSTMDFDIKNGGSYTSSLRKYREFIKVKDLFGDGKIDVIKQPRIVEESDENISYLLTAIRTKPFLLLAGISGTGKSRIVKQLAYMSCPNYGGLRNSEVAPGNYCMIEVKPNWHDSTELLGYESVIKDKYVWTPFVQFLIKAMRFPNVPFFVCLDEMNLAPVEQYFAEFLSVLESRKKGENGEIISEPLIKADIFNKYGDTKREQPKQLGMFDELMDDDILSKKVEYVDENVRSRESVEAQLKCEGLCIPANVIVVGTVNMDETTHQFSRKVIDRAMTIEMNIGEDIPKYFEDFFDSNVSLGYYDEEMHKDAFLPSYTSAIEAMHDYSNEDVAKIKSIVPKMLVDLNKCLENTPFEVAYRVQNELIIYICELRKIDADKDMEEVIAMAMDDILMMKVLPRIEGDDSLLKEPLGKLLEFCKDKYSKAYKKIDEMNTRLKSHFTSYWP